MSFLTTERLKKQNLDAFLEGAPDLAVEILSPSNTAAEMCEKTADYFGAGCRVVWLVDTLRRSVTVHRPDGNLSILTENDTLSDEELLPDFSVAVRQLFPAV